VFFGELGEPFGIGDEGYVGGCGRFGWDGRVEALKGTPVCLHQLNMRPFERRFVGSTWLADRISGSGANTLISFAPVQ
jgi:hypothetical protein